jgi:signal transduction histidine kinase
MPQPADRESHDERTPCILPMVSETRPARRERRHATPTRLADVVLTAAERLRERLGRLLADLPSPGVEAEPDGTRLHRLADEAETAAKTLRQLGDLVAPAPADIGWVAPRGMLEGLVAEAARAARDRHMPLPLLTLDVDAEHLVQADPPLVRRVLATLLDNAIEAAGETGEVVITSVQYADAIEIEVADSGPGLSSHARAWLFEPGFTTKPDGSGVALAAARQLTGQLGGSIDAINCPEGGTAFTLRLPRRMPQRMAA